MTYDYSTYPRIAQLLAVAASAARDPNDVWGSGVDPAHPVKAKYLAVIENLLADLDSEAWQAFQHKAAVKYGQPDGLRGWQQIHDHLNEAVAYRYLKRQFGGNPLFVSETRKEKRPDLELSIKAGLVLCEAKTVNRSQRAIEISERGQASWSASALDDHYFRRVESAITKGKEQLMSYRADENPRRVLVLTLHFDDLLNEYVDQYRSQLTLFFAARDWEIEIVPITLDAFYLSRTS